MSVEEKIRQKLQSGFNVYLLEVINESSQHQVPVNAETHFRVLIVSDDFQGLSTVKRHQKVYGMLKEELHGPVHAFSQRTFTIKEWNERDIRGLGSPPCHRRQGPKDSE